MIFSIQTYLDNYFRARGFPDRDEYAMSLAGLYEQKRSGASAAAFLRSMHSLRTSFYKRNPGVDRKAFETKILGLLDGKFKNRQIRGISPRIAERLRKSGERLGSIPRLTIKAFLHEFKNAVEAESVNSFWESRQQGKLRSRAEKLGQDLLGIFAHGKLAERGAAVREGVSGTGFVDVLVTFSSGLLHIVELKMLKATDVPGPTQLNVYMNHKHRKEGWLVFFDARPTEKKQLVPESFKVPAGTIRTIVIEVNPTAPSKLT